jgi:hypothetical protein
MLMSRRLSGILCGLVSVLACHLAWGQALTVTTDTTETGAQTYTSGEIKNRATYTISGSGASVGLPSGTDFHVGNEPGNNAGSMIVTNGAHFSMTSGYLQVGSDDAAHTSRLIISGASFTNTGDLVILGNFARSGPVHVVADNGATLDIKGFWTTCPDARIDISGGAVVNSSDRFGFSVNLSSERTIATISGTNTRVAIESTLAAGALQLGRAGFGSLALSDGARMTVQGGVTLSGGASSTGLLTMTSGAFLSSGLPAVGFENYFNVGYASGGGNVATVDILDPGTVLMAAGSLSVGGPDSTHRSSLTISKGALVANPPASGPWGVFVTHGDLLVTDGGTLEGYVFGSSDSATFRIRDGGIIQFIHQNPVFYAWGGGPFEVENGGVGFVDINNAPVAMENRLTNLTFTGTNFFVLNNAGNTAISSFNFEEGISPTNWASLRLIGSNCAWRCDATRLAPSGSLLASNTTATLSGTLANEGVLKLYNSRVTVAGDLSLQTGSTLLVDLGATNATVCSSLTAEGGVTLGGTLQVVLRAVPEIGVHYRILDKTSAGAVSGAFASGTTVSASFGGKTYGMTVKYGSGDGNDVDLVRSQAGTVVLIR